MLAGGHYTGAGGARSAWQDHAAAAGAGAGAEYALVESYLINTHAPTHKQYSLELIELFSVSRARRGLAQCRLATGRARCITVRSQCR